MQQSIVKFYCFVVDTAQHVLDITMPIIITWPAVVILEFYRLLSKSDANRFSKKVKHKLYFNRT